MKTELRPRPHLVMQGATIVEIWHEGQLIGTVTGCDHEPGVRILSKYPATVYEKPGVIQKVGSGGIAVGVTEICLAVPNN